jgi:hypothetical protein
MSAFKIKSLGTGVGKEKSNFSLCCRRDCYFALPKFIDTSALGNSHCPELDKLQTMSPTAIDGHVTVKLLNSTTISLVMDLYNTLSIY